MVYFGTPNSNQLFLMELNYISYFNEFEREYKVLNNTSKDVLTVSLEIIHYIEKKLKEIYNWLQNHIFKTLQEEIHFFKELKPRLVSKLIYYKAILKLETTLPQTKMDKKKQYEKLLMGIHYHAISNQDLYEYYRSRSSDKDEDHFVRHSFKDIIKYDCCLINFDSKLSTSHDYNVATIMANDLFAIHLENKLDELNGKYLPKNLPIDNKFNWTGSKVDMTELVYAFQATGCINNGNFDLKELAIFLGTMLNVEIDSNLYGNYSDIKSRKVSKTRFINTMSEKLIEKMDNDDSKKKH
ncbi:RteC domain-containing protein [Flavobacterium soyangense]|uniref:RteC domain-containing protein n=1 Tax=Flavobacterium soyangense TaxID=2023265 RepID=A0A930UEQ7_9FLAO|nr:RteC domain-containing protein [Flavobacterium soyangense]MBF2709090.1 RteC domain-containing protein [Flavobacterium soyangense]